MIQEVIVIGCGVSGLTSGIRLLEAGYSVKIWARDLPPFTTSDVAAAIWYPYKAYPEEKVLAWGARSYAMFYQLAGQPGSGVTILPTRELFTRPTSNPLWSAGMQGFRRALAHELPPGYCDGYVFDTPVIEMTLYLKFLINRLEDLGGLIEQRELTSLDEALATGLPVVNCTGLGALTLLGDQELFPIRGQIIRVTRPALDYALLVEDDGGQATYVVPRSADCVLGGTADVGSWSLEPDPQTAQDILARCRRLVPALAEVKIIDHLVGLRPGRSTVRVAAERLAGGGLLVHNYGHGGAGVTISWGCADEVSRIVQQHQ